MSARKDCGGQVVIRCDVCQFAEMVPRPPDLVHAVGWEPLDEQGERHVCPECRIVGIPDPAKQLPGHERGPFD